MDCQSQNNPTGCVLSPLFNSRGILRKNQLLVSLLTIITQFMLLFISKGATTFDKHDSCKHELCPDSPLNTVSALFIFITDVKINWIIVFLFVCLVTNEFGSQQNHSYGKHNLQVSRQTEYICDKNMINSLLVTL